MEPIKASKERPLYSVHIDQRVAYLGPDEKKAERLAQAAAQQPGVEAVFVVKIEHDILAMYPRPEYCE